MRGVLRALSEAGVRLDVVAGRGMGAVGALFAAVDAGQRLWDPDGLWLGRPGPPRLYRWRFLWRVLGFGLAAVALGVLVPFAILAGVAVLAPFAVLLDVLAPASGEAVVRGLADVTSLVLHDGLGALIVSRIVVVAALVVVVALATAWIRERSRGRRRRPRGPIWWEALGAPLDAAPVVRWVLDGFWRFVHGATKLPRPDDRDLSRRYAELLADNLTQPGYRELIIADARPRDAPRPGLRAPRARTARAVFRARMREVKGARKSWTSRRPTRSPWPTPWRRPWRCRSSPNRTSSRFRRRRSGAARRIASAIVQPRSSGCSRRCRPLASSR